MDARREIGKWLNEQPSREIDRQALAELCAEYDRMRHRIECLRGGLKSAAGWLLDADDMNGHSKCLEMAGDMEPPLMGSNAPKLTGRGTGPND